MKFVNIIRRIVKIDEALERIPNADRYDDILDRLYDKRDELVAQLKAWRKGSDSRTVRCLHRKQLITACRLMGVEYYRIVR